MIVLYLAVAVVFLVGNGALMAVVFVVWKHTGAERLKRLRRRAVELRVELEPLGFAVPKPPEGAGAVWARGELQGVLVELETWSTEDDTGHDTFSDDAPLQSRVVAMLSDSLHRLLKIREQGFMGLVAEEWTGRGDLKCGANDLDLAFHFSSPSPRLATAVLQQACFQEGLRAMMALQRGNLEWLHNRRQRVLVPLTSPLAPVAEALAESVAKREAALPAVLHAACGLPGLTEEGDASTTTFVGELDGARMVVQHDAAADGVRVVARPKAPLPAGLFVQCADHARLTGTGRVRVSTGDLIIDKVLTVAVPHGEQLELQLAQDGVRERLVALLKERPGAQVVDGAVVVPVASFDRSVVEEAAREAAALAGVLGTAAHGGRR